MKALILAGGFGTRIRPLTVNIPKPMLPLTTRPILEHTVKLLLKNGIDEMVMLLYFHPDVIKNFFNDGSEWGAKIKYVIPNKDLGTAGAVKEASRQLNADRYLVISGDLVTDFSIKKILQFHEEKEALSTITLTRVKNPLQFGIVITDENGKIIKFLEKPTWGEVFSDTINTGIYILERSVMDYIPDDTDFDFSRNLFPALLADKKPLYGYIAKGYWRDIGDPDAYREANYDILDGKVYLDVPGKKLDLVGRDVRVGQDVVIDEDVIFKSTVIVGNNTKIQKGCTIERSIVGNNCIIESGVKIKDSILWDNIYVKAGSIIDGTIIMDGVFIEKDVKTEEGVVIGNECRIGKASRIKKHVHIWPRKFVEQASVVSSNLIWGEVWKKSLFQGSKIKGLTNIELTPELCAKLGAAYGSILPKDSFVLLGRDSHLASRMLRRAFIGGVASTGINIKDAQMLPIPVLKYKLHSFGEQGGVYFRQSPQEGASTEIHFFDEHGIDISPSQSKSIERIFFREDFRRAHHNEIGSIVFETKLWDFYREGYLKSLDLKAIKENKFRIVVDFSHGTTTTYFPYILEELVDQVVNLNTYTDYKKLAKTDSEIQNNLSQLAKIVKSLKYDAGFYLYPAGGKIILVDNKGRIYRDVDLLTVISLIIIKTNEPGIIDVPNYTPSLVFETGEKSGFDVRVASSSKRAMSTIARKDDVLMAASGLGDFIFPDFHIYEDGMFAIGKTLEALSKLNMPLSDFIDGFKKPIYLVRRMPCPWDKKGTVMRRMSEEAQGNDASFLDGVRINFNNGWVMLYPDEYGPYFNIYVEGKTKEEAEHLMESYSSKIEQWIK